MRALLCLILSGCAGSNALVANAVANSLIAVTAAAVERARGNCVASCPVGTTCNHDTGLCDTLPCRGACRVMERCDTTRVIPVCVPAGSPPTLAAGDHGQAASQPESPPTVW
ncbi:MAG: hypothetical protein IT381_08015 [Deltaproteobacteria bacterium]|nr:hypothetical protein [Deltaproteobacteria bacterium]